MSGRQDGTTQTTHAAGQLQAAETPTDQVAQIAREIAAMQHDAVVIPSQADSDRQDLAEVTSAAPYTHREQELDLLDWTISNLYHVSLILLPAARQHSETAQRTAQALQCLDDTICRLRDHVTDAHANGR